MNLTVIRGLDRAKNELRPLDALDLDSLPSEVTDKTKEIFGEHLSPSESVCRILEDVRLKGDSAVHDYTRRLDGVDLDNVEGFGPDGIGRDRMELALGELDKPLKAALELAAFRIEKYHIATLRKGWVDMTSGLGEMVLPLERVGIYAPGGTASYPSTVLMTAIPARVAGVKEVVLATPPRDGHGPHSVVLAAACLAGVDRVFPIGGVQAIGALAYGTETVPKVDKICGPGNLFVTLAKRRVYGQVDIDGLYGPTETVVVADDTADPAYCAADLLAQAEHDPLATPILLTTSLPLIAKVEMELENQMASLDRGHTASLSIESRGRVVLVDTLEEAIDLANSIAPEHLCLMVREPWAWSEKVRHAGGLFLGPYSPEVMGDYVAGPSHVMPTGGTARFSSALSVHHFQKTMPVVGLKAEEYGELAAAAAVIARAEGLTGHARAVEIRLDGLKAGNGTGTRKSSKTTDGS